MPRSQTLAATTTETAADLPRGAIQQGQRRRAAMSVAEAAVELGLGRDGVYRAIAEGRLDARKFGRRTLITATAIDAFLNGLPPLSRPPHGEQEARTS